MRGSFGWHRVMCSAPFGLISCELAWKQFYFTKCHHVVAVNRMQSVWLVTDVSCYQQNQALV